MLGEPKTDLLYWMLTKTEDEKKSSVAMNLSYAILEYLSTTKAKYLVVSLILDLEYNYHYSSSYPVITNFVMRLDSAESYFMYLS